MRTIKIPTYNIVIELTDHYEPGSLIPNTVGTITSTLKELGSDDSPELCAAMDAIESFVLSWACAGFPVQAPAFVEAIETAVDAVISHLSEH